MRHQFNDLFHKASNRVLPTQECSEKKERYDTCFIKWYSESTVPTTGAWDEGLGTIRLTGAKNLEYLRGESQTDECAGLFKEYQVCLNVRLYLSYPPRILLLKIYRGL